MSQTVRVVADDLTVSVVPGPRRVTVDPRWVVVKVDAGPVTDVSVRLRDAAVRWVTAGFQGPEGAQGAPGTGGAETFAATAGQALSALRAVRLDPADGLAYYADKDAPAHARTLAGVTVTAAAAGGQVTVRAAGPLVDAGWAWDTGGDPGVYVGANGVLVQGAPGSAAFHQRVASVTGAGAVLVRVDPPVFTTGA